MKICRAGNEPYLYPGINKSWTPAIKSLAVLLMSFPACIAIRVYQNISFYHCVTIYSHWYINNVAQDSWHVIKLVSVLSLARSSQCDILETHKQPFQTAWGTPRVCRGSVRICTGPMSLSQGSFSYRSIIFSWITDRDPWSFLTKCKKDTDLQKAFNVRFCMSSIWGWASVAITILMIISLITISPNENLDRALQF